MSGIEIITTGGTIDKVYFDEKSSFEVGDPQIGEVLSRSDVTFEYRVTTLFKKDSLELDDADRQRLFDTIDASSAHRFVVTHGTDTMVQTAQMLVALAAQGKRIVLTGSMQPAMFYNSHAIFNIGCAVAAVQVMPPGVYIAMNGRIFNPANVRKNRESNRFEDVASDGGEGVG